MSKLSKPIAFKHSFMLVLALVWAVPVPALAHSVRKGDLVIDHPYATPGPAGGTSAGAWFRGIENRGNKDDSLLSASTPVAGRVAIHSMEQDGTVMRMYEVPSVPLPANSTTPMRHNSGQYHLVLMDLKKSLQSGDRFDLTLIFERAGKQTVKVWVQTPREADSNDHQHGMR